MRAKSFETYLREQNLSENSIRSYLFSVNFFLKNFGKLNSKKIMEYKDFLLKNYKVQTVNLRLIGLNKYLKFLKKTDLVQHLIKENPVNFMENVISIQEYEKLKNSLKLDGNLKWHFIVRFLASTGVRVSELVQIKIENIIEGFADIKSKGSKIRRIYIPKELKNEMLEWLGLLGRNEGFLFLNQRGVKISERGIRSQLRHFAKLYGINENVVHPHSFRHFFAKKFLEKHADISFLADLLGHENLDTTRVYLRKSSREQNEIINSVVIW